jgi:hypothetical protein
LPSDARSPVEDVSAMALDALAPVDATGCAATGAGASTGLRRNKPRIMLSRPPSAGAGATATGAGKAGAGAGAGATSAALGGATGAG